MTTIIPSDFFTLDSVSSHPDPSSPCFRKINFEYENAINLVSAQLRHAWKTLPPQDTNPFDNAAVKDYIKKRGKSTSEQEDVTLRNPDMDSVHTPWRDALYEFWNHVFYDVGKFLPQACPGNLCHRPPACDIFDLGVSGNGEGLLRVWEEAVLLIPAFLRSGVSIRAVIVPDETSQLTKAKKATSQPPEAFANCPDDHALGNTKPVEEAELGIFDSSNPYEIWYIKKGARTRFHVEDNSEGGKKGLGAVMVYGPLCEMDDEELLEREVESSRKAVLRRAQLAGFI